MTHPETWTTSELFHWCQGEYLISMDDDFEDWMNDRPRLLEIVMDNINEDDIEEEE